MLVVVWQVGMHMQQDLTLCDALRCLTVTWLLASVRRSLLGIKIPTFVNVSVTLSEGRCHLTTHPSSTLSQYTVAQSSGLQFVTVISRYFVLHLDHKQPMPFV